MDEAKANTMPLLLFTSMEIHLRNTIRKHGGFFRKTYRYNVTNDTHSVLIIISERTRSITLRQNIDGKQVFTGALPYSETDIKALLKIYGVDVIYITNLNLKNDE